MVDEIEREVFYRDTGRYSDSERKLRGNNIYIRGLKIYLLLCLQIQDIPDNLPSLFFEKHTIVRISYLGGGVRCFLNIEAE